MWTLSAKNFYRIFRQILIITLSAVKQGGGTVKMARCLGRFRVACTCYWLPLKHSKCVDLWAHYTSKYEFYMLAITTICACGMNECTVVFLRALTLTYKTPDNVLTLIAGFDQASGQPNSSSLDCLSSIVDSINVKATSPALTPLHSDQPLWSRILESMNIKQWNALCVSLVLLTRTLIYLTFYQVPCSDLLIIDTSDLDHLHLNSIYNAWAERLHVCGMDESVI